MATCCNSPRFLFWETSQLSLTKNLPVLSKYKWFQCLCANRNETSSSPRPANDWCQKEGQFFPIHLHPAVFFFKPLISYLDSTSITSEIENAWECNFTINAVNLKVPRWQFTSFCRTCRLLLRNGTTLAMDSVKLRNEKKSSSGPNAPTLTTPTLCRTSWRINVGCLEKVRPLDLSFVLVRMCPLANPFVGVTIDNDETPRENQVARTWPSSNCSAVEPQSKQLSFQSKTFPLPLLISLSCLETIYRYHAQASWVELLNILCSFEGKPLANS